LLDHPATKEDVKAGRALFDLDGKGKLHNLHLPAYGILKKDEKTKQSDRVLIVQAEIGTRRRRHLRHHRSARCPRCFEQENGEDEVHSRYSLDRASSTFSTLG
jgi:hypothetical protein